MNRARYSSLVFLLVAALLAPACKKASSPSSPNNPKPSSTPTYTPTPSFTGTESHTYTFTNTQTISPTHSLTLTSSPTASDTSTHTLTPTDSLTPTWTETPTASFTETYSPTPSPTDTPCANFAFGYSNSGPSYTTVGVVVISAISDLPTATTVTGLRFYLQNILGTDTRYSRVAIYNDNGSRTGVGTQVVQSASAPVSVGWNLFNFTPTSLPAGTYWLAVQFSASVAIGANNVASSANLYTMAYPAYASGLPADGSAWGVASGSTYSIYAVTCGSAMPTHTATATKTPTGTPTLSETPTSTPRPILKVFGAYGTGNGKFMNPYAVAVDASGNVYGADTNSSTVHKFDSNGTFLLQWTIANDGSGRYNTLTDLQVDPSGNIYVVEQGYNLVQKFNPSGGLLATYGTNGNCCGAFNGASGMAMDDARMYVADHNNGYLQYFDLSWNYSGYYNASPYGVASRGGEQLYASLPEGHQVKQFGGYYKTCGGLGAGNGQLNNPHGIALDSSGRLYVADTFNSRIQIFSPASGQTAPAYLDQIQIGLNPNSPYDVALDASGNIYVADTLNYRILKFGPF